MKETKKETRENERKEEKIVVKTTPSQKYRISSLLSFITLLFTTFPRSLLLSFLLYPLPLSFLPSLYTISAPEQ